MKPRKTIAIAGISMSAAVALSGSAAAKGSTPASQPGATNATQIGNIKPINLISGSTGFAVTAEQKECCGPYAQCKCPDFKGTN
ncbi:MAG TPA: hypothetical protein VFY13_01015 [Luteolibacter sp.]|nr:hypothetical protein [Luteolibacter sp.]